MVNKIIKEIQYLRALAVITVLLFHLDKEIFKGGFIGVDIFFVISGFLMIKILKEKNYSVFNFYKRRFKRIFPVLLFVCILTVFIGSKVLFLNEFDSLIRDNISALTFTSNILFWLKLKSYFADTSIIPLLHTWSLSLEIQFYFIIPFIIFILNKLKLKFQLFFLLLFVLTSLILCSLFIGRDQSFYLLPFRINEFFLGTILYLLPKKNFYKKINGDFVFIIYNFLIIYLLFNYENINFPGIDGFLICLFTTFFLYFNHYKLVTHIINFNVFQFIGKISYSLFLIHLPVLVFYKLYLVHEVMFMQKIFLLIFIFVFSVFTFYFIENKIYKIKINLFFNSILVITLLSFFLLTKYSENLININQNKIKYKDYQTFIDRVNADNPYELGIQPQENDINFKKDKKNILIFGDSHANDVFFALNNQKENNYNFIYLGINSDCFEILSKGLKIHFFEKFLNKVLNKSIVSISNFQNCKEPLNIFEKLTNKNKFEKLIISMKWSKSDVSYSPYILNYFRNKFQDEDIYVMSRRLEIMNIKRSVFKVGTNIENLDKFLSKNLVFFDQINNDLKKKVVTKNVNWVNFNNLICTNHCEIFTNNKINYADASHFTIQGGRIFLNRFVNNYNLR
jgi:peptidoglycan/LPS O-acetylase OafA/YrhL